MAGPVFLSAFAFRSVRAVSRPALLSRLFRVLRTVRVGGPFSVVRTLRSAAHRLALPAAAAPLLVPSLLLVLQVLLLLSVVGAMLASVRQKIISSVRACQCCHGYGIQRCAADQSRPAVIPQPVPV